MNRDKSKPNGQHFSKMRRAGSIAGIDDPVPPEVNPPLVYKDGRFDVDKPRTLRKYMLLEHAAPLHGCTVNALRKRIKRGTLVARKYNYEGRVRVFVEVPRV